MSKLRKFLNFVSNSKGAEKSKINSRGILETDAVAVHDDNGCGHPTSGIVQELNDYNYNSVEREISHEMPSNMHLTEQNNTMNVNNAQQQLVMNFNNANNLHFGTVYNINSSKSTEKQGTANERSSKHLRPMKTTTVVAMMQSKEEPDVRILDTISTHLGEGWKQIMRDLGHTEGQIEQAIIDHQMHGNIKEVIYQLLLQWVRGAEDDEATLGRITTILWERKYHDVVQRMKLTWKETQRHVIK